MKYNLIEATDTFMTRPQFGLPRGRHFYPSEASVCWKDTNGIERVSGQCLRQSWYRLTGNAPATKADAYSEWIFALGKAVEVILVEQWKQMGIWVANNVKFYDIERNISGELDVVLTEPDGTLFGVECCTPDSLVVNSDYRLLPLLNIDGVISHTGRDASVINFQTKQVEDEIVYSFNGKLDGLPARFTGEHPILTGNVKVSRLKKDNKKRSYTLIDTSWKKASDVVVGDYICIPKAKFGFAKEQSFYSQDAIGRYDILADENDWQYRVIDDRIYSYSKNALVQEPGFPTKINNLEDFYWLLGLYVAEGSCSHNTVYFSLHQEETDIIKRIESIVAVWGLNIFVKKLDSKGINVGVVSKAFRELIKTIVPGNTVEKTKYVKYNKLDKRYLSSFLYGVWQGDGCKASTYQYRITTAVPHLAYLYFQVAAHIGQHPRLKKYKQQSQFNSEYIYSVEWGLGGSKDNIEKLIDGGDFWCYKVKKIKTDTYTGPVYNLECENEHTYTVAGIATHNCKSFYGYQATKKICGNKSTKGRPKDSQLLQTLIYVDLCNKLDLLDYFKMIYYARDSANRAEFDITLTDDQGKKRPTINNVVDFRFTMDDIYTRYAELDQYLQTNQLPPRDYQIVWSPEQVEERNKLGEIAKTTYEKWHKKPDKYPIGDWQCRYCPYSLVCYKK